MPSYDYKCAIHDVFEATHSIKDKLEFCPKCQEEGLEPQKVIRLISLSTFVLTGGSWAKEGYK